MPDQKPTLEYARPEPRKRSRFLEKLNPKATLRSVVRKAMINGIVAAAVWWLLRLNHNWHPEWWAFVSWELAAVIVGAVSEWQSSSD
jgi:hypothetical protein